MAIKITIDPQAFAKLDELKATVREVIFASHLDLDAALRNGTPVDTGYAVNSWQAMANGSPAPRDGFEGPRGSASDPGVLAASVGGVLTLANTAEYMPFLAAGSSPQAPAGWVEQVANQYEDFLDKNVMLANGRNR